MAYDPCDGFALSPYSIIFRNAGDNDYDFAPQ